MKAYQEPGSLSLVFRMSVTELATIESTMPRIMANKIADRFVEENWPKIKADKALTAEVRQLVVDKSTALISSMVEEQVGKALGVEPEEKS